MQTVRLIDCVTTPESLAAGSTGSMVLCPARKNRAHSLTDLCVLGHLAALRRPRKVLELGTGRGATTLNLLLNAPEAAIHTLGSIPPGPLDEPLLYGSQPDAARVHQYWGNPPLFGWERVGRGVDFLLVNTPLSYEEARSLLGTILPTTGRPEIYLWRLPEPVAAGKLPSPREGIGRFLAEIADLGLRLIEGTSWAALPLAREKRAELAARLGVHLDEEA